MERRFDMSDFEQSLKEHADQFKLMPSKRVWNGIYNDLHPGSKWPSITVGIIFLITLITVGNLNNKSSKTVNKEKTAFFSSAKTTTNIDQSTSKNNTASSINISEEKLRKNGEQNNFIEKNENSKRTNNAISSFQNVKTINKSNKETEAKNNVFLNNLPNRSIEKDIVAQTDNTFKIPVASNNANSFPAENSNLILQSEEQNLPSIVSAEQPINFLRIGMAESLPTIEMVSFVPALFTSENSLSDLSGRMESVQTTNENKPFNLKKALRKKNKNTEWVFYVTPNISTVSFDHKTVHPSVGSNSGSIVVLPNQTQPSLELIPNPRIGFESGAEVKTKVAKNLKVVSGFNFNYSSYNTISNIVHPTIATLILENKYGTYTKDYITYYGNGQTQSHVSLSNYNVRFSIPVGFEYTIWENKKMAIDIQSAIEPSVVLAGKAYLLSSDGRYYVTDPSLMRKINLGGNFGSFVSFSSKKIRWHIGPNIRYQFLSSYKNNYSVKEHFIDYGIRIGISKAK